MEVSAKILGSSPFTQNWFVFLVLDGRKWWVFTIWKLGVRCGWNWLRIWTRFWCNSHLRLSNIRSTIGLRAYFVFNRNLDKLFFFENEIWTIRWSRNFRWNTNLYITKSWSVAFNVATLTLRHISSHVISIIFFEFVLQLNFFFLILKCWLM